MAAHGSETHTYWDLLEIVVASAEVSVLAIQLRKEIPFQPPIDPG